MPPAATKVVRFCACVLGAIFLLALLIAGWGAWSFRASLAQLDGSRTVSGLAAAVTIERDALGVPTIRAGTRIDAARALGFLHAQDRFFQMDLMRRSAAGELAEMFGARAVPRDRAARMHGFRTIATQVVERLAADERALLEAYTAGVNTGLAALGARPFEYLVLRETPVAWRPEDSVLVIYAMTLDLQDGANRYEQGMHVLHEHLGPSAVAFFNPLLTPNDAALDGSTAPLPPIPGPDVVDLRTRKTKTVRFDAPANPLNPFRATSSASDLFPARDPELRPGSNAFALAGAHTASGAAMLANDMHLDHAVPNTWYRAVLDCAGRRVVGVTLPGTPAVVAGSNGAVAWGFTNSYTDTADLVLVETQRGRPDAYAAPGRAQPVTLETRRAIIRVKDAPDHIAEYAWTIWGPIVSTPPVGQPLALRWASHEPEAANLTLLKMETAETVAQAVAIAHRAGMPPQNLVVADRAGDIAWTIAGRLPKRVGFDGRLPVSWASGEKRWDGLLEPDAVPVFATPAANVPGAQPLPGGRIWSGNNRHAGGEALAKLGDGDYARAARGAQIRDDLAPLEKAAPRDLLAVQLDDRTLFLAPWHKLMLGALTPEAAAASPARQVLRGFVEKWDERATVDALSYRLVREFRIEVLSRVFTPIFATCNEEMPRFPWNNFQIEPAIWALLREQPAHLLDPRFASWDEMLLSAVDDLIKELDKSGVKLPQANWGWRNTARIRHPFGNLVPPWIGSRLSMPAEPLPGGDDMPRVQGPGHGASERLVVSPGREEEGIFHMPGGQSAHPLSPFFRAGHSAWVRGEPTPLLPGKTEHTLRLVP